MLDYARITLFTIFMILAFFLYQAWVKEHPPVTAPAVEQTAQTASVPSSRYIPATVNAPAATTAPAVASTAPQPTVSAPATVPAKQGQLVSVTTDVLQVKIDTAGGDIVDVRLSQYPESLGSPNPIVLLNDDDKTRYIAESGLLGKRGPDTSEAQAIYTPEQTSYTLDGKDQVVVRLNWQASDGLKIAKIFTFSKNSYEIRVSYDIENQSTQPWEGNLYTQLMRTNTPPPSHGIISLSTYFGAAISTPDKLFEKIPFKTMQESNLSKTVKGGWAAMIQHYFISAWVPPAGSTSTYYSRVMPNGLYTIGMIGQPMTVAPGAHSSAEVKLYAGPSTAESLEKTAPGLNLTVDYGVLWLISVPIFWLMQKINGIVHNWGWSIVLVTIIIKLLFYGMSAKSYRAMSAMKKLQPRMEMLKQRYADDKQKLTQATMELYKQEKVNPVSGCLPILLQIPVFIALYWVIVESVELRQAPFILWIHDLSQQDPYYVLPVLMGLSMFIQQRLNPPPPDPMQAKIMMAMPVVFTILFASFPAALMLYWFVNNTLSFLQQWYIMRSMNQSTAK